MLLQAEVVCSYFNKFIRMKGCVFFIWMGFTTKSWTLLYPKLGSMLLGTYFNSSFSNVSSNVYIVAELPRCKNVKCKELGYRS